ncbi:DUF4387 domain-containing protein [Allopusillimonas ginsengisoli]|uniref:DUF4387 domain-containing protein n=1 Tax=Allopusillimonas ginsengisoli TaxID=453575 RepID=UPI001020E4A1|nr:DUF4387 domain-containing protein [Allopusillimonas ginsengisoli]TEA78920.1 DUF4387 family protein [Allopusillimonas ginsengisoli]
METIGLSSIASVIRSKNAGPFLLTFDVLFESFDKYCQVWEGGSFTRDNISVLFGVSPEAVTSIFAVPRGQAIKLTLRRPLAQGKPGESDMYGCQQHAPLLDFQVKLKKA